MGFFQSERSMRINAGEDEDIGALVAGVARGPDPQDRLLALGGHFSPLEAMPGGREEFVRRSAPHVALLRYCHGSVTFGQEERQSGGAR